MANRQIEAKLLLSAVDRTGKAFRSVSGRLDNVNKRADKFNRNGRSTAQTAVAVGRAAAVVGTAVGAVGVASYKKFASDERTLTRIGITAEATREQMADIREELFATAKETGLQFEDMIGGLAALTNSGRNLEDSMALLPSVAATAQASGAAITDIATSADALFTSMNINAKDMQNAFDILVAGGKAGKFELRDMAQYLPSLAPAARAIGYEGAEGLKRMVAWLQVVRTNTGTASEAATAFGDVLNKMESQTVNNNFKKFGVDLRGSLAKAREEGENILSAFRRIAVEAVDGDLSKLPQLFTDKQMLIAMRGMINGIDDFESHLVSLNGAAGSTFNDLGRVLDDNQTKIDNMATSWDNFISSFGAGVAPVVGGALDGATDFIDLGDAITEGMKKDGLGFWARISQHGGRSQDDPQMIEWAKKGGFKFEKFDGGSRETGGVGVPTPAPVGGKTTLGDGSIPTPSFRANFNPRTDRVASRDLPVQGPRRPMDLSRFSAEDYLMSQGANGQSGIAPSMSDVQARMQGSMTAAPGNSIKLVADMETGAADAALSDLSSRAAEPMNTKLDLDTSEAEAKINRLQSKVSALSNGLKQGGGRDRGRSMPGAG